MAAKGGKPMKYMMFILIVALIVVFIYVNFGGAITNFVFEEVQSGDEVEAPTISPHLFK